MNGLAKWARLLLDIQPGQASGPVSRFFPKPCPSRCLFAGAGDFPEPPPTEDEVTEKERLEREIYVLGETIEVNVATLASKTMRNDNRVSLQRQMTRRMKTRKLLKERLAGLPDTDCFDGGTKD